MGRTKVVGPTGSYGARYGLSVRRRVRDILIKLRSPHICPFCGKQGSVTRIAVGLWECRKCNSKWAGGAYTPLSGTAPYAKSFIERKEWP
ncbi:MAG: 50S ribosomal protein L37ae [Acidilobaceae archaeon]